MKTDELIQKGREVLRIERDAVDRVLTTIDRRFARAIQTLRRCRGKVIVTGVGKSGIIAQKLVATLNSTGTPAFYLHPGDALHGDLGMARPDDAMIIFSKSGDTPELARLLPSIRHLGLPIIAVTGNERGLLARNATVVLDCTVEREACAYDLAPTASTTAMLALADALAVTLYLSKGFTREDFAGTHPGGTIGRRLLLRLGDMMKGGDDIPIVRPDAPFSEVVAEISRKRMGCVLIVSPRRRLLGIITDGDLRRLLERRADVHTLTAADIMTPSPMSVGPDIMGSAALALLEEHKRTHLPVVDTRGELRGIVHMHDLIEAGLAE